MGTSLAIVTSLMASINTAIVVVLSTDKTTQAGLGFLTFTPDQVGTTTGTLAILLFVAATVGAVYAQAANYDELPADIRDKLFLHRTDKDKWTNEWEGKVDSAYKFTGACWVYGVSMMLITLGTLAYGKVPAALPVLAVIAIIAAVLNLFDPDFQFWVLVIASVLVAGGCGAVAAAAIEAIWF